MIIHPTFYKASWPSAVLVSNHGCSTPYPSLVFLLSPSLYLSTLSVGRHHTRSTHFLCVLLESLAPLIATPNYPVLPPYDTIGSEDGANSLSCVSISHFDEGCDGRSYQDLLLLDMGLDGYYPEGGILPDRATIEKMGVLKGSWKVTPLALPPCRYDRHG